MKVTLPFDALAIAIEVAITLILLMLLVCWWQWDNARRERARHRDAVDRIDHLERANERLRRDLHTATLPRPRPRYVQWTPRPVALPPVDDTRINIARLADDLAAQTVEIQRRPQ